MLLYIIGFSGAGKSTLVRQLSVSWHIPAWDTDQLFTEETGLSIAEYIKEYGWTSFREKESEILTGTPMLDTGSPSICGYSGLIACGGGVVESVANRDFLRTRPVLWLAPIWNSLIASIHRSPSDFCKDKSDEDLWAEYRRRLPLYRDCLQK
ncbi:MAG: shikimate kinase [Candidatus Cloacimonadales bacterium]|jgi:shikimate kinase|nr:hypothetical protein [Candidatus Cloacimonadota bacterium]MDY0381222.1 shikimate kinase [Candidatus Cloacimonadaceae bacterium]HCM15860.1 hypothetical protein [Candidatus Cloacimonas sp.]MCB5257062.1 hypothetical protein [Candidatus Cloacimonadota bacterium]MCB5264095.1 hypothetical protein [Candidatus Cloacimonadota bacterium]